ERSCQERMFHIICVLCPTTCGKRPLPENGRGLAKPNITTQDAARDCDSHPVHQAESEIPPTFFLCRPACTDRCCRQVPADRLAPPRPTFLHRRSAGLRTRVPLFAHAGQCQSVPVATAPCLRRLRYAACLPVPLLH